MSELDDLRCEQAGTENRPVSLGVMIVTVRAMASELKSFVSQTLAPLEARLAALEARPELKYAGVWKQGETYAPGSLATHHGSLWHCHEETTTAPPSSAWQLCAKRGRDGKDAGKPVVA